MDVITIDGQAATGKSTLASRVAAWLGWAHVSTGDSYRAIAAGQLGNLPLRDPLTTARAARLARSPALRKRLRRAWRRLERPLVADGRDAGTHTWPNARLKLHLHAPLEWRVGVRHAQVGGTLVAHRVALAQRDAIDRQLGHGPAPDATVVRVDAWSEDQVVDLIRRLWGCRSGA